MPTRSKASAEAKRRIDALLKRLLASPENARGATDIVHSTKFEACGTLQVARAVATFPAKSLTDAMKS